MSTSNHRTGLQLRSLIKKTGELELSLVSVETPAPKPDEVVVRVEASPINPSDLGLLTGPADPATANQGGTAASPVITARVPDAAMAALASRVDIAMPVGNEGAGVVVETGSSEAAKALMGKTVAVLGGAMYSQYRTVPVSACLALPGGARPAQGASAFINPLTALGMVETMKREGHTALVHTAAASNLGQILHRICLKDGVSLVNVVRKAEQVEILRGLGAPYVCNTESPAFRDELIEALTATGATLVFDAIGGGKLAGQILAAMEVVLNRKATAYSRYGSSTHKQAYLYGVLDTSPTELPRNLGMAWGVGGWLLTPFLQKLGPAGTDALKQRVAAELTTTFASTYAKEISLAEALQLDTLKAYARRATGTKYLINPHKA